MANPSDLPDHESGVRRLYSDAHGLPYVPLRSLAEAKQHEDGIVVMEGDWGGQIYLVCPARFVACDEPTLNQLLQDLDTIAWECNEGEGARVYFERASTGSGIAGGMGGGAVTDELWVHKEFHDLGLVDEIRGVLQGFRQRIKAVGP